jgi:aspartate/methionine/tyrosine aminotransferase
MMPHDRLQLRPVKAAKVSEVSEATATSPVPPEERVNFHIGNPVQDERLTTALFRIALGLHFQPPATGTPPTDQASEELGLTSEDNQGLEFLLRLVRESAPYMPRGGYLRTNPNELIRRIHNWLCKEQPDPLAYDLGEKSGVREIILATGGITETFRVFFHALSSFLIDTPVRFFLFDVRLPHHLLQFPQILVTNLPLDEQTALRVLREQLGEHPGHPTFLALGRITREETRRHLRQLCGDFPLFIIEANDAPNSASLAREARMSGKVLRFLTPSVLSRRLAGLPTVIVAGTPDLVQIIEVAHFQLKGSPSAPEIQHLSLLLGQDETKMAEIRGPEVSPSDMISTGGGAPATILSQHAYALERVVTAAAERIEMKIGDVTLHARERAQSMLLSGIRRVNASAPPFDPFAGAPYSELFEKLVTRGGDPEWQQDLSRAFLAAFLQHHPEYEYDSSFVVSGSSRTALGLLGFHCDIREVITPDLSWTYEHCFPRVTAVPLTADLQIDVDGIIRTIEERLAKDDQWRFYGAVALNNPHNATGQAFPEELIRQLVQRLLERNITVIDDLAYQYVVPSPSLAGPPTIRQIADALVRSGYLTREQGHNVVTVHSVSKTDCLAGSRLAVVEICRPELRSRFASVHATVAPNVAAILLSYLFYRAPEIEVNGYWRLRNQILEERMTALEEAVRNLPTERNRYGISIRRPTGSMYPLMMIRALPSGISLDWLSSGLARQGIGLLPLSAFARTEEGFEAGRSAFRLTLGGTDGADRLLAKTRRVLIDLNRMMAEEESRYSRRSFTPRAHPSHRVFDGKPVLADAERLLDAVRQEAEVLVGKGSILSAAPPSIPDSDRNRFIRDYVPERLSMLLQRAQDRIALAEASVGAIFADDGKTLERELHNELDKDSLVQRRKHFRERLCDRTVHPTQMYSLEVERIWDETLGRLLRSTSVSASFHHTLATALLAEFAGLNVSIASKDEGEELILDLDALLAAEQILRDDAKSSFRPLLSYWGDWDGSTRPSGQGHQLAATVLIENVRRLGALFQTLRTVAPETRFDKSLIDAVAGLSVNIRKFRQLLNEITLLTHQLERRYRGLLPYQLAPGQMRKLGMKLGLARDPLTSLWEHNDRLERRMLGLRRKRKEALEYYFRLNKALRKALHAAIPAIRANRAKGTMALEAGLYRDLLKRVVITPRIHQKLITAQDQFAIDTTVHNITEINDIGGMFGNPGMVLGLQVSMSTSPDALIALDRKLRSTREEVLRLHPQSDLATVWLIPLFEDLDAVKAIEGYLKKIWEYAVQSRRIDQETSERLTEIIPEIFIAGSDLSQQVGQTAGTALYREAKQEIVSWLAQRGLVGQIRIKMGSGEPMQRQGGYYAPQSGLPGFNTTGENSGRLGTTLPASAKRSVEYATTPLMGIFATGDLRTFQSNLAEKMRALPALEYARVLFHVHASQRFHERELSRAAEPLFDTRLQFSTRGLQELERLTVGKRDPVFQEFVKTSTANFRQITYGTAEDVVGLHIISYFIARTTPPLRDRPTVRPGRGVAESRGHQIVEKIAETIPLSKYGSLLRAIAHNQAQTAVLGVNQLTTGLFRAFQVFSSQQFTEGAGGSLLADRVLPNLPVYEILHSLRLYHDVGLPHLKALEPAFPAGTSALTALREDMDGMERYLGLLRKELVRRHGLTISHFFEGDQFIPNLLPTVRPDLAVLLQSDLFNTDLDAFLAHVPGPVSATWAAETRKLLAIPVEIRRWRSTAWDLLKKPVFERVQSFVELAVALSSLTDPSALRLQVLPPALRKPVRPAARGAAGEAFDDSLGQFLAAASEYLSGLSQQHLEVPTTVVRALKEVEHIMKIEEQALSPKQQEQLRFYLLQIARLAGENG